MGRVRITKERKLITYSDLWRTSEVLLKRAEAEAAGSYYLSLASLVFDAFALEAFLNHIGENVYARIWQNLESLQPKAKLNVLCERVGLTPDWDVQPWQVVPEIVAFRNKVAHGKNELLRFERIVPHDDKYEEIMRQCLFAKWQNEATTENAVRVHVQLHALFKLIHEKANIEDEFLFHHGSQTGSGEFLPE